VCILKHQLFHVKFGTEEQYFGSDQYQRESKMVATFHQQQQQQQSQPSSDSKFSNAMIERIKELMEPFALEQASNLNYLCLVRYLSYLPVSDVENIFRYSIDKSFDSGCSVGLSSLPKLLASYVSAASHKKGFLFEDFEANVREGLREGTSDASGKQQEILSFFDLLLQSMKYLIKTRS